MLSRRTGLWVVALAIIGALSVIGLSIRSRTQEPVGIAPPMSVAIIPFRTSEDGVTNDELASRLTQDTIMALARGKRARVPAYALVAGYKVGAVDPRAVGRALGVRYVAEGDIRVSTAGATLTTRLYDAIDSNLLSTDATEVAESNAGARDALLSARAAYQITMAVGAAERGRRARTGFGDSSPDLLSQSDAIMRAENYSIASTKEALKLIDEVLRKDPNDVSALVRKFWALNSLYEEDLRADRDQIVNEMDKATGRAVAVDSVDADAWHARSITYAWQGRWAEADEAMAQAKRLDPTDSYLIEQQAFLKFASGRPAEAVVLVEDSIKRSGIRGEQEMRDLCWYNVALGHYELAKSSCERASALSGWWKDDMFLASAYAHTGHPKEAADAIARVRKVWPNLTIQMLRNYRYSSHPDYRRQEEEGLLAGLRMAGIPEN